MTQSKPATQATQSFAKGRDLDEATAVVQPWLAEHLGVAAVEISGLSYPKAGFSNETILFEAKWDDNGAQTADLVLRVAPRTDYQMFYQPRFRMQFDLLSSLHRLGTVRVPEPLWYEADDAFLGQPFFVMRRMHGNVPVSLPVYNQVGFLFDASPEQRRTAWLSAMTQLTAIHRVPVAEVTFVDQPERGATGITQQLSYWREFCEWSLGEQAPAPLREAYDVLEKSAPSGHTDGLSWGDARIGNMMFGSDFEVLGVMDWEQASLAGGEADLGWWLMFDDIHSTEGGLPRLEGLGGREETIELWESATGLRATSLNWHEAFAGIKASTLALHSRSLMSVVTEAPPGVSPWLRRACAILEIPLETTA
jgi:aminoglycoside phosphotransferase (APT) family kinase protein